MSDQKQAVKEEEIVENGASINPKAEEAVQKIKEAETEKKPEEKLETKASLVVSDKVKPTTKRKRGRPKKTQDEGPIQLFDGPTLLLLADIVASKGISFLHNQIVTDESKHIDSSELLLTPSEHEKLLPSANAAAEKIGLHADPITKFGIFLGITYATKLLIK